VAGYESHRGPHHNPTMGEYYCAFVSLSNKCLGESVLYIQVSRNIEGERTMGQSKSTKAEILASPSPADALYKNTVQLPVFGGLPAFITPIKSLGICCHKSTGASNPSEAIRDTTEPSGLMFEYIGYTSSPLSGYPTCYLGRNLWFR